MPALNDNIHDVLRTSTRGEKDGQSMAEGRRAGTEVQRSEIEGHSDTKMGIFVKG